MKWYIAVVLSLAVVGAAVVTRPGEASFQELMEREVRAKIAGGTKPLSLAMDRRLFPGNYRYRNLYLWADMELDGKVLYVGAFSHWFARGRTAD